MLSQLGKSGFLRRASLTRAAIIDPELPRDLVEQLWNDPAALVERSEMMRRTGLRRTVHLTWGSQQYVLKQYRPTWWHFLRQLPLQSWAADTFKITHRLIQAGIATPRPVACIENRWGSLRRDSFLMYEYVEGVTLRSYLKEQAQQPRPLGEHLAQQLREIWRRLEESRVSLADAHTGNFIVGRAENVWLIDLDKTRFHRWNSIAARNYERGWEQFVRSAGKCGPVSVSHLRIRRAA